jgi:hypothetical protein
MKSLLSNILKVKLNNSKSIKSLDKLHGDASYRVYYRLILEDGSSFIVMKMPEGKSSASEEITNFNGIHTELPFINVNRFLKNLDIYVPEIFAYDKQHGVLILEDLGDELFYKTVLELPKDKQIHHYKKAIELIILIQQKASKHNSQECIALQRSFDAYLLNWEFDHFTEYGIEARLGTKMPAGEKEMFAKLSRDITNEILKIPYAFTHRDYQSRNIIFNDTKMALIDFQDALMGPCVYDLVALLRDSYISLSDDSIDELVSHYAKLSKRNIKDVEYFFNLVTVQRKMKDAGRFVYIEKVKGNDSYLKFIPTSIGYARHALEKLKNYQGLLDLTYKYFK